MARWGYSRTPVPSRLTIDRFRKAQILSLEESTASSLIVRLRNEQPDAWERLVKLYAPLVYQWTRRVGLADDDAADVGQEVFRTVFGKIGEFDRRKSGAFRAWLWTITRNKIGDYLKKRKAAEQGFGGSDSRLKNAATFEMRFGSDSEDESKDHQTIFAAALRLIQTDFQEQTWQAFWRVTIENQSVQQVAEDLGMEPKAIRQAKYRVLKRLREEFADLFE